MTVVGGLGILIRGGLAYRAGTRRVTMSLVNPYARRNAAVVMRNLAVQGEAWANEAGVEGVVGGIAAEARTRAKFNIRDFLPIVATIRAGKELSAACPG